MEEPNGLEMRKQFKTFFPPLRSNLRPIEPSVYQIHQNTHTHPPSYLRTPKIESKGTKNSEAIPLVPFSDMFTTLLMQV